MRSPVACPARARREPHRVEPVPCPPQLLCSIVTQICPSRPSEIRIDLTAAALGTEPLPRPQVEAALVQRARAPWCAVRTHCRAPTVFDAPGRQGLSPLEEARGLPDGRGRLRWCFFLRRGAEIGGRAMGRRFVDTTLHAVSRRVENFAVTRRAQLSCAAGDLRPQSRTVALPCTIVRHHALSDCNMARQKGRVPARSRSIIQLISHTFPSDPEVARSL